MAIWDTAFEKYRNANKKVGTINEQSASGIGKFGEEALRKNPNLNIFDNASNNIADIIDGKSVVSQFKTQSQLNQAETFFDSLFSGIHAMPIYTNKGERIRQYRTMAEYTECDFCLCELADDMLHEDEEGEFIRLTIPNDKTNLNDNQKKILQIKFNQFIDLFKLKDEAFSLTKRFLTEGEIAFENIINPEKPYLGIIGVKYLPTEYYETLLNTETGKVIGIVFDKDKLVKDQKELISNSCLGSRTIFNQTLTSTALNVGHQKENSIPLLMPQITYISSGETSPDGRIVYPLIEKCKQSYHQLALMQDAAVILRVTRAPERLLFNIDVGGAPEKVARQRINEFINKLKSKKIITSEDFTGHSDQDIRSIYNPVTMLESYFFGKTNGHDATTVESVGSTADFEQIADIEFFLRRLFKQFKVPFSRYKTPENTMERNETISYEEYSMARSEIRIQRRFAMGLKKSFITHLKLLGLWKKYNMRESDFSIDFNTPALYNLYQQQKQINAKMDAYKAIVDQEEFSKTVAMKKILKMTDEQIDENFRELIREKQQVALADYFSDLISEEHKPIDYKSPIRLTGIDEDDEDDNNDNNGGDNNSDNEVDDFGNEEGSKGESGETPTEEPESSENDTENNGNEENSEPEFGN